MDDIDGCPMGWDPLDGAPVDDIDGVPCESFTYCNTNGTHWFVSSIKAVHACLENSSRC